MYNSQFVSGSQDNGGGTMACRVLIGDSWKDGIIKGSCLGCILVMVAGVIHSACPEKVLICDCGNLRAVKIEEVPHNHEEIVAGQLFGDTTGVSVSGGATTTTTTPAPGGNLFTGSALPPQTPGPSPVVRAEHVEEASEHTHQEIERPELIRDAIAADTGAAAMPDPGSGALLKDPGPQSVSFPAGASCRGL